MVGHRPALGTARSIVRRTVLIQHSGGPTMKATRAAATIALLLTFATAPPGVYAANGNPGVIPPHASYRGLTYGEWEAKWWQAAFALPVVDGKHPVFTGGAFGGEDGVVFLAAVFGSPAEVDVVVPSGTPLFFPVINVECSVIEPPPFHGDDEAALRACANGHIDLTSGYSVELDGKEMKNLAAYRVESPLFELGPLPA